MDMPTKLITKQQLIAWATALKDDSPEIAVELWGGGTSHTPGRTVLSYYVHLEITEEFPDNEKPALDLL